MTAEMRVRWRSGFVRICALRERGGRVITAGSTGSTPRDCAGGPSIKISREGGLVSEGVVGGVVW